MSNQSLREAGQQALECKRLAHDYASACAGCDPEDFAAKERDEMYAAIDKLARLARPAEQGAELSDEEIDKESRLYLGSVPANRFCVDLRKLARAIIAADRAARGGAA